MTLNSYYETVKTDGWKKEEIERLSRFCFPMMAIDMNVVNEDNIPEILIQGLIGPRGDAYERNESITENEAEDYHSVQLTTLKEANVIAGTLSKTSKMPCRSYGITARACQVVVQ